MCIRDRPWPDNVNIGTGSRIQTTPSIITSSFVVALSLLNQSTLCGKTETPSSENDKMKRMKPSPGKNFTNSKRENQSVCAKIYPFLLLLGIFSGNKLCNRTTRFLQEEKMRHNCFYSIVRAHGRTTSCFHSNIPSQWLSWRCACTLGTLERVWRIQWRKTFVA